MISTEINNQLDSFKLYINNNISSFIFRNDYDLKSGVSISLDKYSNPDLTLIRGNYVGATSELPPYTVYTLNEVAIDEKIGLELAAYIELCMRAFKSEQALRKKIGSPLKEQETIDYICDLMKEITHAGS